MNPSCGGTAPRTGLSTAPNPVSEFTLIVTRSGISIVFIGDADMILPSSIMREYSFPKLSVAVSLSLYPIPVATTVTPVTPIGS